MTRLTESESRLRNQMWSQGQLWCNECKQFKPAKKFYKWSNPGQGHHSNYGYRRYCIECENAKSRNRPGTKAYFKTRNARLKIKFAELAGGTCQRCGYSEFVTGLEFHHVYRAEKKYSPAVVISNGDLDKTWRELDKCCLLCSCCHSAYEAGEWRAEFIKREGLGWTVGEPLPLDDARYEAQEIPQYQQAMLPDAFREVAPAQMALFETITRVYH